MEPVGKYKISQEARRSIDCFVSLYIRLQEEHGCPRNFLTIGVLDFRDVFARKKAGPCRYLLRIHPICISIVVFLYVVIIVVSFSFFTI